MHRFIARSISALGGVLANVFAYLGDDRSIGWVSDDTFGWDLAYLYRQDAESAALEEADEIDLILADIADHRNGQAVFTYANSAV